MGKSSRVIELRAQLKSAGGDISGRHTRTPWSLPVFATFVTFAFVAVTLAPPSPSSATAAVVAPGRAPDVQSLAVGEDAEGSTTERDEFTVTEPEPEAPAASLSSGDAGKAQEIAFALLQDRGWGEDQFNCLVSLWNKESHWNVSAENVSSGAYGIPQALPGEKMASVGSDWRTNPKTQIIWGLGYIEGRYGDPCGAWATSEDQGWY